MLTVGHGAIEAGRVLQPETKKQIVLLIELIPGVDDVRDLRCKVSSLAWVDDRLMEHVGRGAAVTRDMFDLDVQIMGDRPRGDMRDVLECRAGRVRVVR